MPPKIILVLYSAHEQDQAALNYAFNLAKAHDARIEAWHIAPALNALIMSYDVYGAIPVYPEASVREMDRINEENRNAAEHKFRQAKNDSKLQEATFHFAVGKAADILSARARIADLVVIPRTLQNISYTTAAEGVIFGGGRPVLLVPPAWTAQKNDGKILLAWNGSRESARAVSYALPHMAGRHISILTNQERKTFSASADDLRIYLKAHGMDSEILTYMDEGSNLGAAILNTGRMISAGLIVMGAWSHSRVREHILGGVTEYMLHNADIPLFMAH